MTTTFLLVRHAAHDWLGRGIAGRLPGVELNAEGHAQAQALVTRLHGMPIDAIYCSPQARTRQTAQPLAAARELPIHVHAGFDEIDFGDWMGRTFEELDGYGDAWRQWVERRGSARPPGGEAFEQVPQRALSGLHRLRAEHAGRHVAVFSHGDIIKAVVASCLGMSLDHLERFEIAPASVTMLVLGADWSQLKLLNAQAALA